MMVGDNLLELQVARPREPQELASFFVDQAVQQDGAVHMASRVDPLFLLLPVLCKHATKWCPLDQALAEGGCGSLRGLRYLDANKLCDINDRMGPDDLLIRINEQSVLGWLSAKVERATKRFTELASGEGGESRWAGGSAESGGFAKEFRAIASPLDTSRDKEVKAECRQRALEAVCEYLGDEWATKLAEKFSTERGVLFGGKSTAPKKRKAVWEESAEADRNLELSHGSGGGSKAKAEAAAAATKAKQPMSHAQRSLAKVNKKGMKSISSFFGKK
eukprot:g14680.t1